MTFRTRILLACLVAALLPLILLAAGARYVVRERLIAQYEDRIAGSGELARRELATTAAAIDARLRVLEQRIRNEPALRAALLDTTRRAALIDFAPAAMTAAGLDLLLLLDADGTTLSSGHFRNAYGRPLPGLTTRLAAAAGPTLVAALRPADSFVALVRARELDIGGRRFALAAGIEVDSALAARVAGGWSDALVVTLAHPGGVTSSGPAALGPDMLTERIAMPFIDATGPEITAGEAEWKISHSLRPLRAVTRSMDRWFVAALAAAVLVALVIARILAARVTRPLEELARRASRVELDRYDVALATRRQDEIGSLSRLLDRMVQRLRAGARQLRDAERRATVGDMARQVNHDIRNGLLPIRNVIHHLAEVAKDSPAALGTVFSERAGTLQAGLGYLENLATNYARLTPRVERQPCNVNDVVRTVVNDSAVAGGEVVRLELDPRLPEVPADPVALRRIIDNLVVNAVESLDGGGEVIVRTAASAGGGVVITVADTGVGIAPDLIDRIFDDFHTTKERGSGLGLSIVRRLVADMGGRIGVHSDPHRGTTFTIELPAST
ncbi:MAG TPA: ATP-binding protein [Longimicrobiales bacterium]